MTISYSQLEPAKSVFTKNSTKMRLTIAFCFIANFVVFIAVLKGAKTSSVLNGNQTPSGTTNHCGKTVVCNCNLNPDSMQVTKAIKTLETKLENLIALVNKTLPPKPNPPAGPFSSCKELYEKQKSTKSQVYPLMFGFQKIPVYCHMGNFGCGDGGWTLAMKIDGTKKTFHYDSHFWSDRNGYNLPGGKTGFDSQEAKLPSYWNTPFSKICLGMKIGHQTHFIVINRRANSLYSLIADGKYRATSVGRNTWKALIGSQASLQRNCNKEGFNADFDRRHSKARIGFIANQGNDCNSCDSRIGFGTGGYDDDSNTCGNQATHSPDNGNKHIKAMGYILVQ